MLKQFMQNCAYPQGAGGSLMLSLMNAGHGSISKWALAYLPVKPQDSILDIGCGGGKNIARMLKLANRGRVSGLDYSEVSVLKSLLVNARAVQKGRAEVLRSNVSEMPFADSSFDIATAFETIYFWPDLEHDFVEVCRVLKPGGLFCICNAMQPQAGQQPENFWTRMVNLNLYDNTKLETLLAKSGFCGTEFITDRKQKKLCVLTRKAL